MSYKVAGVYIMGVPYHADLEYSYYIPPLLTEYLTPGKFVCVPFGNSNSRKNGIVSSVLEVEKISEFKPVYSVLNDLCLSDEELKLAFFMKDRFFCTISDAVKTMIPPDTFSKYYLDFKVTDKSNDVSDLNSTTKLVYTDILNSECISMKQLCSKYGEDVRIIVNSLIDKGYIIQESSKKEVSSEVRYSLSANDTDFIDFKELLNKVRGLKQKAVIQYLFDNGPTDSSELKKNVSASAAQIKALLEKSIIHVCKNIGKDVTQNEKSFSNEDSFVLTDEQEQAVKTISSLIEEKKPNVALLNGITGSGKTVVIKKAIDYVIRNKKQVILLVPEISLTPQTIKFFTNYYGNRVSVIHSSLSNKERYESWQKIKNGEVDICIGTRSAVFAPFKDLGLIVIDEEHEHTYKSEQNPKYCAIDIAKFRGNFNNCLILLSSATPSVESYYKAQKGIYKLIELSKRYGKSTLPDTVITDLRVDYRSGNTSPIGNILRAELDKRLLKKEQSILFVNRRGYNNYVSCGLCGNAIKCPHCSVSLTLHNDNERYLICHYCGYKIGLPKTCPECGNSDLIYGGFGTQKIEEEIINSYQDASVLRMDADTTAKKDSANIIIDNFSSEKSDILIGTQMVTKGHNFLNVTLVGVLLADNSLYMSDYRSNEKTFQLITQVIGRAGRSDKKGMAVIQTFSPENETILLSASQNYKSFYQNEIRSRKALLFPPFCDLAVFSFSSKDETLLINSLNVFNQNLFSIIKNKYNDIPIEIFGPFANTVYKIKDLYKMRYIIKCKNNIKTRKLFSELLISFNKSAKNKVSMSVDINPYDV